VKHCPDGAASQWRPVLAARDREVLEQAYADAVRLGFLGPREQERLWERHLDDAFALAVIRRPKPKEHWADLGSGAGLPGLPLAVAHRTTTFTLIDAQRRRVDWVAATAAELHLTNVEVVHARCEDFLPAQCFDNILSRAFGTLRMFTESTTHLLCEHGQFIAMKGKYPQEELNELPSQFLLQKAQQLDIKGISIERHVICLSKK